MQVLMQVLYQGVVKDVNVSKRHATITVGEHVPGGRPEVGGLDFLIISIF